MPTIIETGCVRDSSDHFFGFLRRIPAAVKGYLDRAEAIRTLSDLSDRELADIGLTPGDVHGVVARRALRERL